MVPGVHYPNKLVMGRDHLSHGPWQWRTSLLMESMRPSMHGSGELDLSQRERESSCELVMGQWAMEEREREATEFVGQRNE
jgi:hypothetical protein